MATLTLLQAVNDALHFEMEKDDRVVCLGEDIGINGGVFRATEGLFDKFGADRVIDTPLTESGIIGAACGMALYGLRPVPEIQFSDFIWPGFDQLVSEVAKMRYRSGGQFTVPMVLRSPYGGGIRGGHYHSQSPEAYFVHTPGLKVVIPSTPSDTKGLLLSAIRDDDPVVFLEPKRIYRTLKGEVPAGDHTVPIGKARIVRPGQHLSIFCYGAMVSLSEKAAELAKAEGIDVEIVDLRSLMPMDEEAILASVTKTGRALVVYEAPKTCAVGSEISAIIAEKAIEVLEAPILRVAGFDTPFPYALENVYMPDAERILDGIRRVAHF